MSCATRGPSRKSRRSDRSSSCETSRRASRGASSRRTSAGRTGSTRSVLRRNSPGSIPESSSRSIRRPRRSVPSEPRRSGLRRGRSSSGPRRPRTYRASRRRARRINGRRGFDRADDGGPGLPSPGRPLGRGSRGGMHHPPPWGGGERQDELLLAARAERRPRGTQGDLHRHGRRLPRAAASDLRDDFELVAKNILFSEPYSFEEQEKLIEKAVKL